MLRSIRRTGNAAKLLALAIMLAPPGVAASQDLPESRVLPAQQDLNTPVLRTNSDRPSVLPPAPRPGRSEAETLSVGGLEITVSEIRIYGNTALSSERLTNTTRPFLARPLGNEDLIDLQRRITEQYVEAGYTTSYATLPDQDLGTGSLDIRVVEGRIAYLRITDTTSFSDEFIEARVIPNEGEPLNVRVLERRLQVLQLNPLIAAVRGRLSAAGEPGSALLELEIVEQPSLFARATVANDRSTSVGATGVRLGVARSNNFGINDRISVSTVFSRGIREAALESRVPFNRWDTTAIASLRYSESEIVSRALSSLDLASRFWDVGLAISHPLYRSPSVQWTAEGAFQLRESLNRLDDAGFSTSLAARNGRLRVSVFRLTTEASYRDSSQALAARATASFGVPIFGASTVAGGVDDSRFVSFLGQVQWARRIDRIVPSELVARFNWQLALDPLPPFERFSIGGVGSVRGYPENRLVRDSGFSGSIEWRIALMRDVTGNALWSIAPFLDGGRTWLRERGGTPSPENLLSAGVGVIASPRPWLDFSFYWGAKLNSVPAFGNEAQDRGMHFAIDITYP